MNFIEDLALRCGVLPKEADELTKNLPSTARERANFLLKNPKLRKKNLGKSDGGSKIYSNCHGTAVYLIDFGNCLEQIAKEFSESKGKVQGVHLYYKGVEGSPPSIEYEAMEEVLESEYFEDVIEPLPGDVVSLYGDNFFRGYYLAHSGVMIDKKTFFEQRNIGGRFNFDELDRGKFFNYGVRFSRPIEKP